MHRSAFYDVDGTLVSETKPRAKRAIRIIDPVTREARWVIPHKKHLAILRRMAASGDTIIVWSAAGSQWAAAVVLALGLAPLVRACLQKPNSLFDDEPPANWMPTGAHWYKDE